MIELAVPQPEYLPDQMSFRLSLDLAASSGALGNELFQPLKVLNKMRNRVAHELGSEPAEPDERELMAAMPDRLRFGLEGAFPLGLVTHILSLSIVTMKARVSLRQELGDVEA